jgi:NADH-quinone oxidoreductase subunit C
LSVYWEKTNNMLELDKIIEVVKASSKFDVSVDETSAPKTLLVDSRDLKKICETLHQNESAYFDMLSCITGIDNGPEAKTMEVVYHLYSIPFGYQLALKVILSRVNPEVDSVTSVWGGANWLERETYDMYGIRFTNHPDLRRILMPADWDGYPLRKDYKHQDEYRGVKVEY